MTDGLYTDGNSNEPIILEANDLPSIAKYMKRTDACKNIFIMAGAGISTAAGIPDFRSPETGLYHNLARLDLPHPQAVFEIGFFRRNPVPFYTLAHELAPGRFRPTLTHSFIRLLAEKSLLHTCFTQNIDTLERRAGVPPAKIIEAHGSFASQHCIDCGGTFPDEKIKQMIKDQQIPRCERPKCNGLVKPDIVFFGEAMPTAFHRNISKLRDADLLIVMGTSLTVHPFASLTDLVPYNCPRLLINLDLVGDFDRPDDVICLKKCDDAVRELCKEMGWEEELDKLWVETAESLDSPPPDEPEIKGTDVAPETDEAKLEAEVNNMTEGIEKGLDIGKENSERKAEADGDVVEVLAAPLTQRDELEVQDLIRGDISGGKL